MAMLNYQKVNSMKFRYETSIAAMPSGPVFFRYRGNSPSQCLPFLTAGTGWNLEETMQLG